MATIEQVLQEVSARLRKQTGTPALEARLLAAHVTGKTTSWVAAHPEHRLDQEQTQQIERLVRRYEEGEPLPYILGHWEFYGLDFLVNPSVLIPRPETELLVESALRWLKEHPDRHTAVDAGTGSG